MNARVVPIRGSALVTIGEQTVTECLQLDEAVTHFPATGDPPNQEDDFRARISRRSLERSDAGLPEYDHGD
jgi:hypothetical protein